MKKGGLLAILILFSTTVWGQFTLTKGSQVLELSGVINTYYNYRFYDSSAVNFRKNRFRLRDAQFKLEGKFGNELSFQLEFDLASLNVPEEEPFTTNPFLNDAFIRYKTPFGTRFTVGYQKIRYSRNSIVPIFYSPFLKRPVYTDGNFFHRRDVGITVDHNFALGEMPIRLVMGAYNGTGSLSRNNDPSGKLEYAGRLEVAWPAQFKYREVDLKHVPVPQIVFSANARYANLQIPSPIGYAVSLDGRRWLYGGDIAFQYQGFSTQIEWHQSRNTPNDTSAVELQEKPTAYFRTGGLLLSANYYAKDLKSIFAIQYEDINPNDLILGNFQRTFSVAYSYLIREFNTVVRLQYWHRLPEERTGLQWKSNEIRVGLQFLIQ